MAEDTQTIQGLDNFLAIAKQLPEDLVSKRGGVVLSALRLGANLMRKGIRQEIGRIIDEPNIGGTYRSTGFLAKSVRVWRSRRPKRYGGDEVVIVGVHPRAVYPDGTRAALVAGVLESGTEFMEAKAPVRKAFEQNKQAALDRVIEGANRALDRAIKKLEQRR